MCGTIFAISLIASIYLISNFQGHEMGIMELEENQPPIRISYEASVYNNYLNLSDLDRIPGLVNTADGLGDHIVEAVDRNVMMPFLNSTVCPYFITKNQSINWPTLKYDNATMAGITIDAQDDLSLDLNSSFNIVTGHLPQDQKEIVISRQLASVMSLGINDIITIGNNITHQSESGLKIVGISDFVSTIHASDYFIYMQYSDFDTLIQAMLVHNIINVISGYNLLDVYVNLNSVNIYNVNDFVTKVSLLATRIETKINDLGLNFTVTNYMASMQNMSIILILYALETLILTIALLLPVILLSNHVSDTINLEMFEKRAMEFSQFRSRGFDRKQMIKILGWEIVFSACLCAGVSGAIGIGLSYILNSFFEVETASALII